MQHRNDDNLELDKRTVIHDKCVESSARQIYMNNKQHKLEKKKSSDTTAEQNVLQFI